MKAIIMAGGEGTRLRPLTSNRPKPMIPVINKPIIEHSVNLLKKKGFRKIIISLFYLPENVQNYFGDGSDWDIDISYSVEDTPLGTAGGVKKAAGSPSETLVVMSGDGVLDFDIDRILDFHRVKRSLFTIVLTRVKTPTEYGVVFTREDGTIEKFLEKPGWTEVFSDTVNTGLYIIEPDIINNFIPSNTRFDFSLDLFPLLQQRNLPMYGFVADGYWCDVGNLDAYREVHQAILEGRVKIDFPGKKIGNDIWVGRNVEIAPDAKISGPVVLGNFVRVKKGAVVREYTVIGDNCVIEEDSSVKRSIVFHNTFIGPRSEVRGAIIGKRCVVEEGVSIFEGAVVSDDCQIGRGAEIPSGVRIWPEKRIEQGAKLTADLIWGQTEKKTLFSAEGIVGSFNVKITPEFSAKLGSAIGAYLERNASVIISRDASAASRLIKRALASGLLSMGVQVYDLDIESMPINRYSTRFLNADLGIYVQMSPMTGLQFIQIKTFNRLGFQMSTAEERRLENIFFRGDYPRRNAFEVGTLVYPIHHIESYIENACNYIDHRALSQKKWNIIADCFSGTASYVFPRLLARFGCSVTLLRGQVREAVSEEQLKMETRKSIDSIVTMSRSNSEVGVIMGPHGEHLTIVDETGRILSDEEVSTLMCLYYLKHKAAKLIYIPVTSSMIIESIASAYNARVVRTGTRLRAPREGHDIFLPGTEGQYAYLEKEYDPMIAFLRILEFAALEGKPLCELLKEVPRSNLYRTSIPCTENEKASMMSSLSAAPRPEGSSIEMVEGIRIVMRKGWVLLLPDAAQPLIHLYAEGESDTDRDGIIDEFTRKLKNVIR
jgi:mannose-1-phosphate guanylyltransferase/phosphomannomutase